MRVCGRSENKQKRFMRVKLISIFLFLMYMSFLTVFKKKEIKKKLPLPNKITRTILRNPFPVSAHTRFHFSVSAHTYKNLIAFFLSVSFPRMRREVPSLRGDRGKLVYTSQNTFYWFYSYLLFFLCVCSYLFLFLRVYSRLPLPSASPPPSPCPGTA